LTADLTSPSLVDIASSTKFSICLERAGECAGAQAIRFNAFFMNVVATGLKLV
jgi:hypothetical protein